MRDSVSIHYDAVLLVSFGGPETPEDVIPFLENVLRGKRVPRERMLEVAEHYYHFGGRSPINDQNRALVAALRAELEAKGPALRVYWGNRNWHPLLAETLAQMRDDGVKRALAVFTSAFSSYSGCRQYREDIEKARTQLGAGAPEVDKVRAYFNHPGFIGAMTENVAVALSEFPAASRDTVQLVFTAHSIPVAMAEGCRYVEQLREASRLVAAGMARPWVLVYQSRSGPPGQPWLEPDVGDYLREVARKEAAQNFILAPIGFLTDHMEVIYDLDTVAMGLAGELGLKVVRARTVGSNPKLVTALRDLVAERASGSAERPAVGELGPSHDVCPPDCCPPAPVSTMR
jgi:ferrochelatase